MESAADEEGDDDEEEDDDGSVLVAEMSAMRACEIVKQWTSKWTTKAANLARKSGTESKPR